MINVRSLASQRVIQVLTLCSSGVMGRRNGNSTSAWYVEHPKHDCLHCVLTIRSWLVSDVQSSGDYGTNLSLQRPPDLAANAVLSAALEDSAIGAATVLAMDLCAEEAHLKVSPVSCTFC